MEEEKSIDIVRKTLQTLPEENYQVLCLLMNFLGQVRLVYYILFKFSVVRCGGDGWFM